MVLFLLLLLFLFLGGWILTVLGSIDKDYLLMIIGAIVGVIFPFIIISFDQTSGEPSAIDVYRGKTTLEITYKDGVPVDSVVVFKDKDK